MTEVVRAAIDREWQEREERNAIKMGRITEITAEVQQILPEEWRGKTSKQIMDDMYNEDGSVAS